MAGALRKLRNLVSANKQTQQVTEKVEPVLTSEVGQRGSTESRLEQMQRQFYVDPKLLSAIRDIRHMDRMDGRIKKIHNKLARTAVRGGLMIETSSTNKRLQRLWNDFLKRTNINHQQKLESHCRGFAMEGNLPLQWVVSQDAQLVNAIRMPSETIVPITNDNGTFKDAKKAYKQMDLLAGTEVAFFALYQLTLLRLDPDNFDDMGSLGRPYLDATRPVWQKLMMTEEDLVVRRRERAPQRYSHVLDGATPEEMEQYESKQLRNKGNITTDFYQNKKGGVTALQGDANLDQIADVSYLLDTFFSGSPAPKGLFGYSGELSRDILEDLKRDFYEEVDAIQDILAWGYEQGFRLDLLLQGINPDNYDFKIKFAERRTETANQAADRALKLQAMGASVDTVFTTAGLDAAKEKKQKEQDAKDFDVYPEPENINISGKPKVSVTPGNAQKGESATTIATRNAN